MIDNMNLIFLDYETTGLIKSQDRIIEIGMLPVNRNLELLDEGWSVNVSLSGYNIQLLDPFVADMHTQNGLLKELADGISVSLKDAEHEAVEYAARFVHRGQTPLAGSSIHFDRGFMDKYMPRLDSWFHYRIADVSSVKEFYRRWFPEGSEPPKVKAHRALADCYESLNEAKWYRDHLGYVPDNPEVGLDITSAFAHN